MKWLRKLFGRRKRHTLLMLSVPRMHPTAKHVIFLDYIRFNDFVDWRAPYEGGIIIRDGEELIIHRNGSYISIEREGK